jgi:hypothetical protein
MVLVLIRTRHAVNEDEAVNNKSRACLLVLVGAIASNL